MRYHLAVDIGASSGRHLLGWLEGDRMHYEEIHRFRNGFAPNAEGTQCWNLDALYAEILHGMRRCKEFGKTPESVGIDTWGVDFVLLNKEGAMLGAPVAYRDGRTDGMEEEVFRLAPEAELYRRTGIQRQVFNTVFQLMAVKMRNPGHLQQAHRMLMLPDYLHYCLCGVAKAEYTNASTTGLLNAESRDWDTSLIGTLGYPLAMFPEIALPGTDLGNLTSQAQREVGYNCRVVLPATHDTGSAVLAVPASEEETLAAETLYISSGTWSLLGTERLWPDCSPQSMRANFSNEGGYLYRYRYLRNIMGLWMIQFVARELNDRYTFAQLCDMASESNINSIVDCNDGRFLAPPSMTGTIREACAQSGQAQPNTPGELAAVIYNSLARCYRDTIAALEQSTGKVFPCIRVVGGGANAAYLNQLTARATGKPVYAGPTEATAIGNLAVQMIAAGELADLSAARACIARSFEIRRFE